MKFLIFLIFAAKIFCSGESRKIVGHLANGVEADEPLPYHVHLNIRNTLDPNLYIGSGVLISQIHVLTVAFNIIGFNQWNGGVGSVNRPELIFYRATGAFIHENYNASNIDNNIGIIVFGGGIIFDGSIVAPAQLPQTGEQVPIPNTSGTISGFGFKSSDLLNQADHLLIGTQTVLTNDICEQVFPALGSALANKFCAINPATQVTPCGGEAGGGFGIFSDNGWTIVGLISIADSSCDLPQSVTFFVQISKYRLWILTNIGI